MRRGILVLSCILALTSPTWSQTTLDGTALAYRSTGAPGPDHTWRLEENGFVGTYIRLSAAQRVSFTVRAARDDASKGTPLLGLRVADFAASWRVTAVGENYGSHTQIWTLPAGTYCVRIERTDLKPSEGPGAIQVRDLSITGAAVVNKASDALALAAADTYIEHFRRGPAVLTITSGTQPLANTPVRIHLHRHAFNFGTALAGAGSRAPAWLTSPDPNEVKYRDFVLHNFNTIEPENAGKWPSNERERDQVTLDCVDSLVDFAANNGLRVRMHGVLWDVDQPRWVNALRDTALRGPTPQVREAAKAELRTEISQRIGYFVRERAQRYYELDVINESVHSPKYYEVYGLDGVAGIYNEVKAAVRAAGASTRLVPNEYEVLQGGRGLKDPYANWYRRHVESLRNAGGAVDGIGIQYYAVDANEPRARTTHSPSLITGVFHNLATTDLPLSLTEFGVQGYKRPTPPRAAEILAETLRLCFGHEKMTTFITWGFWRPRMWSTAPAAALMDANWNLTPAGRLWQQMTGVRDWQIPDLPAWTTDVSLVTDAQGSVRFTGFYGEYEVLAGDQRGEFTLTKGTTSYAATVNKP